MSMQEKGEGDRKSARRFNQKQQKFVRGNAAFIEAAAKDAKNALTSDEASQLAAAEEAGRSRSKGEDPSVKR